MWPCGLVASRLSQQFMFFFQYISFGVVSMKNLEICFIDKILLTKIIGSYLEMIKEGFSL